MTHASIVDTCEGMGLKVRQDPAEGRRSYSASLPGVRVYWSTSYEGNLLGLPRVCREGIDTHARSLREIKYLVRL